MADFELRNNGWLSVPWAEFVGQHSDHGPTGSLGNDESNSQFSYTIIINGSDLLAAITDILGTNTWNPTDSLLQRTLPARHPLMPHMYAKRIISITGLKWVGKTPGGGVGAVGANVPASEWQFWVVGIGFETPTWRMIDDATLASQFGGKEYCRFCEILPEPTSWAITREGGTAFQWADNGPGGLLTPTVGQPFPSPWGQLLGQTNLRILWHRLPREAVISETGKMNRNIAGCVNKLNNTTFLGTDTKGYFGNAQSGVVRFDSYKVITTPSPLPPDSLGLLPTDFNTTVTLDMNFLVFDPPNGNTTVPYRGHNCVPHVDGLWYLATSNGTPTGNGIFGMADLNDIFTLTLTPAS